MKGKKVCFRIIVMLLAIVTAGVCFALQPQKVNAPKIYAASTKVSLDGNEYSALFGGNIVFSAEKVLVKSDSSTTFDKEYTFVGAKDTNQIYTEYEFKSIENETSDKTVVDNGTFVELKNVNENSQFNLVDNTDVQEAVMVSFGAYVYNETANNVSIADKNNNTYSPISYLDVILYKNGQQTEVPAIRNIIPTDGGLFFDFVFLITQQEDDSNEGYYEFTFNYMVDYIEYTEEFKFYIINRTSYTQMINNEFGYSAKPIIGWTGENQFEQTQTDGFIRYYTGLNGNNATATVSFPTITYDYTKYKLSYTHTANQRNMKYDFGVNYFSTNAQLIPSVTSNGKTTTKAPFDLHDYNEDSSTNLVTIMLTEPGTYIVNYEYIYRGYNQANAPELGIETEPLKLAVHGLIANYSKTNYESAKMQYFEIATKAENKVDLYIPNGYEISSDIASLQNEKLGFVYKLVQSEQREGDVLKTNSVDALHNLYFDANEYDYLKENIEVVKNIVNADTAVAESINNILQKVEYAETNQGSLWITGNDEYIKDDSFYYYSPTKIDVNSMKTEDGNGNEVSSMKLFTNTTSFNAKGYYLVFVKTSPSGISDKEYYQIFAMRYTSSSVNIDIKTESGAVIAGGKYSNENVVVSWIQPGVFDSKIESFYYYLVNKNGSKEELLASSKQALNTYESEIDGKKCFSANLGEGVENGQFVKYLIRLEREGESATHKMFTIDRQAISGVQAYLVAEMASVNSIYYTFATDTQNSFIPINNAVTDSYATITWNDKNSGAEIFANYCYTPFVQNNSTVVKLNGNNGSTWFSTNYELGTTILGADLKKAVSPYNVSSEAILFNQGIYNIKIWDSAGNETRYAFIIDRTQNYFEVENELISNSSVIYGDDVNYSVGDYKVFKLNTQNQELNTFIDYAATNNLANLSQYYVGDYNNTNALAQHFQKVGNEYYLTIKNSKVVGFQNNVQDNKISGLSGVLKYSVDGESYYKRTLYVVGVNNIYSTKKIEDNSFVTVEINKDNARGMVFFSSSRIDYIPADFVNNTNYNRLDTGSDLYDNNDNEIASGMKGAGATSANHVAFVWNMGTGHFEVEKVYYSFYYLKPSTFNEDENGKYYFYGSEENYEVYNGGWSNNNIGKSLNDGRALISFNGDMLSKAGLYVVTREYKEIAGADLGDDVRVKNYYFIVDRNGIIDINLGVGQNIKINLLEQEEEFNDFSAKNTESSVLNNVEDDIFGQRYNIYLNTTKLPAVLNIPTGKYFDGENTSADYYSGKLNVRVYFSDKFNQLESGYRSSTIKIYDSLNHKATNGIFEIDIYEYLTNVNTSLRNRLTESNTNGKWLFLSGDYIIRITDNTIDELGKNHETYIGLRIVGVENNGPQVETKTGYSKDGAVNINMASDGKFNYKATVSQEFLEVIIPKYKDNVASNAQVDPEYVLVQQYYGANALPVYYINHAYEPLNGINLIENSNYVTIRENGISLWLDTKLRNGQDIDYANLSTPLKYVVTVRYKIGNAQENEKYKECYVYYEGGKKVYFFEAKYEIVIDREAPSANINALNKNDNLVQDYNNAFGTSSMIENGVHETSSYLYFTKQYAKYYQENKANKGYIYAYQVDENTAFDASDVKNVYYKPITVSNDSYDKKIRDLASYNLTLPVVNSNTHTMQSTDNFNGYGGIGLVYGNYYEIVEQDEAGNLTQYVIHYNAGEAELTIPVVVTTTSGDIYSDVLSFETENSLNIFSVVENGSVEAVNQMFYKIDIERIGGTILKTFLTTATTNFTTLTQEIAGVISNENYGNFNLSIKSRTSNNVININLYDINDVIPLNVEDLIIIDGNENYFIQFNAANRKDETKNLWYFATEISVKFLETTYKYVGEVNAKGEIEYYYTDGNVKNRVDRLTCSPNTTYYVVMKDVLGATTSYRFNTSGQEFVKISFDEPGNYYVGNKDTNLVYYGYTTATFQFDKTVYATTDTTVDNETDPVYGIITIPAPENDIVEYKIDLYYEGSIERTYYITIDTRLTNVALRDYSTGEQKDLIKVINNISHTNPITRPDKSGAGIMNLYWEPVEENNYFNYVYTLYELMENEEYREIDLTSVTNYVISTASDSKGVYKFEIKVLGKDGQYLGNRLYVFEVQEVSTQIYYVRNEDGEAIAANSSFKVSEFEETNPTIYTIITSKFSGINESINLPLYIANERLEVILTTNNVEKTSEVIIDEGTHKFTIYKISKTDAYDIYLGILEVSVKEYLINTLSIVGEETINVKNTTSYTIVDNIYQEVKLISTSSDSDDYLLSKNMLLLEVYYNNVLTETVEYVGNYIIKGNGQYKFIFKDLAGNIHKFDNGDDKLEMYLLREVVVTLNGEAPIDNAYYNDEVTLMIYASAKYVTGSISLQAFRNGDVYQPVGFNPYVFNQYGTYRVLISAFYHEGEADILLTKVVTFTILNVKEARHTMDLTSLSAYKITKVLNPYNEDKTSVFLEMLQASSSTGLSVSYDDVMKYADRLNVSSGKLTFTISYLVDDGIYPSREMDLSFTLNNETPTIDCSLAKGDKTTKGFDIYFNPAIIYEQIGESYIYINDKMVAHITENSANGEQIINTSFKKDGDADYYIKLVSSSGIIWDSYKVTIKEPLNFWAVVVIIVIVGVVATVAITIIVLRRKMRIR